MVFLPVLTQSKPAEYDSAFDLNVRQGRNNSSISTLSIIRLPASQWASLLFIFQVQLMQTTATATAEAAAAAI